MPTRCGPSRGPQGELQTGSGRRAGDAEGRGADSTRPRLPARSKRDARWRSRASTRHRRDGRRALLGRHAARGAGRLRRRDAEGGRHRARYSARRRASCAPKGISTFVEPWASIRRRRSASARFGPTFDLDTDAPQDKLHALLKLTERYCVVFQTLNAKPALSVTAAVARRDPAPRRSPAQHVERQRQQALRFVGRPGDVHPDRAPVARQRRVGHQRRGATEHHEGVDGELLANSRPGVLPVARRPLGRKLALEIENVPSSSRPTTALHRAWDLHPVEHRRQAPRPAARLEDVGPRSPAGRRRAASAPPRRRCARASTSSRSPPGAPPSALAPPSGARPPSTRAAPGVRGASSNVTVGGRRDDRQPGRRQHDDPVVA